ncbi:MAG: F0F1 ATP synthase subunit B [Planctomycetota bacterium]
MPHWNLLALLLGVLAAGVPALAAADHGDETNIFNADIGNFVFTLIIFGALIFILGRFAWKPLLNVLNEREKLLRESLERAQQQRREAEKLLADYQAQLAKARDEATAIVAEGRRDAEVLRRKLHEQARQEADEVLARARREIQLATDSARKLLHDEVADLAVQVAGRVLRKELSPADHRALVAESLKAMQAGEKPRLN